MASRSSLTNGAIIRWLHLGTSEAPVNPHRLGVRLHLVVRCHDRRAGGAYGVHSLQNVGESVLADNGGNPVVHPSSSHARHQQGGLRQGVVKGVFG